nr:DUF2752 domain-containing protein [Cellulophaga baltica]
MENSDAIHRRNHLFFNLLFILFFAAALLYILISKDTLTCYYKTNYGLECPTCGFTRDFKSILNFQTAHLINTKSLVYFKVLGAFFISRIVVSLFLVFKFRYVFILIADLILISLFVFSIVLIYINLISNITI